MGLIVIDAASGEKFFSTCSCLRLLDRIGTESLLPPQLRAIEHVGVLYPIVPPNLDYYYTVCGLKWHVEDCCMFHFFKMFPVCLENRLTGTVFWRDKRGGRRLSSADQHIYASRVGAHVANALSTCNE